jgi:hypothetical protein
VVTPGTLLPTLQNGTLSPLQKTNRLILFREIIAVCWQNHTEHVNRTLGQNAVYINSVRTSQATHYGSATKPNRLMLSREIIAAYCENHTEHINRPCGQNAVYINSVRTSQATHYGSAIKTNRLMLFSEIIAVYCENRTEHIDCETKIQSFTF